MHSVKTFLRRGLACSGWLFIAAVVFFNLRLYWPSPLSHQANVAPPDIVLQLNANRSAIDSGAPDQMQQFFPEGYYFCYLFHGLTWVELALRDATYTDRAITEAMDCLSHLDSDRGRAAFPSYLPPDHGMFYSAWKSSLCAGVVVLQQGSDAEQLQDLRQQCDAIGEAIEKAKTPFLASYDGSVWPCDTLPAIHAMAAHDRLTGKNRYGNLIRQWISDVKERLDPETGLIPHTASLPDGRQVSVARATSQVIILRMLPDIDAAMAKDHYQRYRERFLTTFVGAPCVLEYPSGVTGPGDVDSGPLIAGRSIVGTVVTIALAQIYGDRSVADAIAQSGETIGLPWTVGDEKNYVGGILPVGNIIVAYAQIARPWFAKQEHVPEQSYQASVWWRLPIHAVSLAIFVPTLLRLAITKWMAGRQKQKTLPTG